VPSFNAGDIEATLKLNRVPFQRDLDKALKQGRDFEKKEFTAALDADRRAFTKAINSARAAGVRFSQAKYDAKLGVDRTALGSALKMAQAQVRRFNQARGQATVGVDSEGLVKELKKIDRLTHDAGITVANNFRSPWRRFKWPAIFAAITAGAVAVPPALLGVAGAVGALAGAFVGPVKAIKAFGDAQKAVAMGSPDAAEEVRKFEQAMAKLTPAGRAFVRQATSMKDELGKFGKAMQTAVLPGFTAWLKGLETAIPAITRGTAAIGRALSGVAAEAGALLRSPVFQGQMEQAFKNTVPVVRSLGRFISNLMRDMVVFTANTKSLGVGLSQMIDGMSRGFTGFFKELTPFSDTLGQSFAGLGGIVEDLFTALGRFSGILSTGLAPGLEILRSALSSIYDVVNNLVAGAMPGLTTAWAAFGSVIGGVATVLAPIAGLLGGAIGALAPFALALAAVNKITFGAVGGQFNILKSNIDATTGKVGKAKTAFRGLATIGLGPLGLAAVALGAILTVLGQRQAEAAERAAEHRQRVSELTDAIIQDGGVIGEITRGIVAKSLAESGAAKTAREYGYSLDAVTDAATGNEKAFRKLVPAMDKKIAAQAEDLSAMDLTSTAEGLRLIKLASLRTGIVDNYNATKEATRAALEQTAAENGVTTATIAHWNALQKLNAEVLKAADANLSYRESVQRTKETQEALATLIKDGKKGTNEYTNAVHANERAIIAQAEAKRKETEAELAHLPPQQRGIEGTKAFNREALILAGSLSGPLPKSLRTIIGGMTNTELKALGAKRGINAAGQAVVRLPNGKTIVVSANTSNFWSRVNEIMRRPLYKMVSLVLGPIPSIAAAMLGGAEGGITQFAKGGMTFNGRPVRAMAAGSATMVPPNTPRLIGDNKAVRESFIPHDNSPRSRGLLAETNRMMGNPLGVGGDGGSNARHGSGGTIELTLRDYDQSLIGRMRVESENVARAHDSGLLDRLSSQGVV